MSEAATILAVDDEPDIREAIETYFTAQGYRVLTAAGGEEMWARLSEASVSLVILDLRMPGEDGLSLCRQLREKADLGVIMLTGAAEAVDRVVGLEMGADDYVAKPFDLRELLARVKSVLRRTAAPVRPRPEAPAAVTQVGTCALNLTSRTLTSSDGEATTLSAMEFDLLKAFLEHPNHALSRDQLLNLAHNRDWDPYDRSIDVRVTRLRKKIEPIPAKPRYIKTIRGLGYLYSPDGD